MSSHQEGPNPLRPYYVPPSIPEIKPTTTTFEIESKNAKYALSPRDIFSDIDYSNYVSEGSQSILGNVRNLLDDSLYKYIGVLVSQPFEVAKTILQVRSQASGNGTLTTIDEDNVPEKSRRPGDSMYTDLPSDQSDPDEPVYFTSSTLTSYPPSHSRHRITDRAGYVLPSHSSTQQLALRRHDSILEVISQLWAKEGAWGVWKGSNATFVYSALWKIIETWSRGLLCALLNVPDPGLSTGLGVPVDLTSSPHPWASLGVAITAAAVTGIILCPLDVVRTKLILTPTSSVKRGFLHNFKLLSSYSCPPQLVIPTVLHSIVSPLITYSTPLLLRSHLHIDRVIAPTTFSLATFVSSLVELFIKLPLETVLRRGQMAILSSPRYVADGKELDTIVNIGRYKGPIWTMWMIVNEEGISSSQDSVSGTVGLQATRIARMQRERRGQGIEGLWRGWRVGFWGLIGVWGATAIGGAANTVDEF